MFVGHASNLPASVFLEAYIDFECRHSSVSASPLLTQPSLSFVSGADLNEMSMESQEVAVLLKEIRWLYRFRRQNRDSVHCVQKLLLLWYHAKNEMMMGSQLLIPRSHQGLCPANCLSG